MARFRISLNEGSLLRRTALHVGAFVLGTAAFLALASFLLITVMKSVLPSEHSADSSDDSAEDAATTSKPAAGKPPRPKKKRPSAQAGPSAAPDDE